MGMPEANQVRAMLAALDGGGGQAGHARQPAPLESLITLTRAAGDVARGRVSQQALAQAIAELSAQPDLPPGLLAYLDPLAAANAAPDDERWAALSSAAASLFASLQEADANGALAFATALAGAFDAHHQPAAAVEFQTRAVGLLRGHLERTPADRDAAQHLSVLLYNQSGYLAQLDRFDEAVQALEAVVAIDEQLGLDDLQSDRAALESMRRRRQGLPPPELVEGQLTPAEQQAALAAGQQVQIDEQAEQIVEAALDALRAGDLDDLLSTLDEAAAHYAEGEEAGSAYMQLAQFTRAVAAAMRGQPALPVPDRFVELFATFRQGL